MQRLLNCRKLGFLWIGLAALLPLGTPAQDRGHAISPTHRLELFNGRDFTGWKRYLPGDADVAKTWSIENGVLKNTGRPTGYLRTEQAYRDYRLTVEWRFVKVAPKADNTGVLVHIQPPDRLWPTCIQCQGQHEKQGDLFLMNGAESKEHQGLGVNQPIPKRGPSNEKPVGEWNTCEMICRGDTVQAYINGKLMNETTACTVNAGQVGIQSEGGEIEIRKLYLDPPSPR